jgi:Flp pilus assembly protein TadG
MVQAAVLHFLRSDSCPDSFPTQQDLLKAVAVYLQAALAVASEDVARLAAQAVTALRNRHDPALVLASDSSCIEVRGKVGDQPAVGAAESFVVFASPSPRSLAALAEEPTPTEFTEDVRQTLLTSLATAPLGVSCAEYLLWHELGYADMVLSGSVGIEDEHRTAGVCAYPTVLEFVLQHTETLSALRPGVAYYHYPGSEDCFLVPVSESREQVTEPLMSALKRKDSAESAAWLLSASAGWVDRALVVSLLNSFTLQCFESYGADAVSKLCADLLAVSLSLPTGRSSRAARCTAHHAQVLALCLDSFAFAAKISVDTAQQCALEYARACTDRSVLRRLLAAARCAAGEELLPVLHRAASNLSAVAEWLRLPTTQEATRDKVPDPSDSQNGVAASVTATAVGIAEGPAKGPGHALGAVTVTAGIKTDAHEHQLNATSDKEEIILRLLETDFHYTDGGRRRPPAESPEVKKLQQALKLLSASLYSSQVHFVMELIQNADDNQYAPSVTPTLRLQLFPHAVVVFNNEVGFSEANIVAVCNVNGSTKAQKSGYIGQKGIG